MKLLVSCNPWCFHCSAPSLKISFQILAHEDRSLRILVVSLAANKPVSLVQPRSRFHFLSGVQINPVVAGVAGEMFHCGQQVLRNAATAKNFPDVHALYLRALCSWSFRFLWTPQLPQSNASR